MPPDPKCFVERAIIRARVPGVYEDKPRWCVVLRVEPDRLEVAYGQGSQGTDRDIVVKPGTVDGRRYKVEKETFFRPGNIASIPREDVIEHKGTCSREHLVTFLEFARDRHLADSPVLEHPKPSPPLTRRDGLQSPQQLRVQTSTPDDESG